MSHTSKPSTQSKPASSRKRPASIKGKTYLHELLPKDLVVLVHARDGTVMLGCVADSAVDGTWLRQHDEYGNTLCQEWVYLRDEEYMVKERNGHAVH